MNSMLTYRKRYGRITQPPRCKLGRFLARQNRARAVYMFLSPPPSGLFFPKEAPFRLRVMRCFLFLWARSLPGIDLMDG